MQKDEELTQFLSDFFLSEDAPDLTDADVEMLMSIPDQSPPGMSERVRAKFTAKILEDLHPEQVQPLNKRWPLGRWIEATRKRARLTRGDIGTALGKDASFVEKLETGEILPWDLDTKEAIDIAHLFRLAVKAMRQLVETSAIIHQEYTDGITVAARSHGGRRSKERKDSMKLGLDLYLARNSDQPVLEEKILNWLGRLEEEFERR